MYVLLGLLNIFRKHGRYKANIVQSLLHLTSCSDTSLNITNDVVDRMIILCPFGKRRFSFFIYFLFFSRIWWVNQSYSRRNINIIKGIYKRAPITKISLFSYSTSLVVLESSMTTLIDSIKVKVRRL